MKRGFPGKVEREANVVKQSDAEQEELLRGTGDELPTIPEAAVKNWETKNNQLVSILAKHKSQCAFHLKRGKTYNVST